jgi:ABC-2 type transport system permease protein
MFNQEGESYSQKTALLALVRASFRAIFANPSALVFSVAFPILFVLIFGAFGGDKGTVFQVVIERGSDTTHPIYKSIVASPFINITQIEDAAQLRKELIRGKITGILSFRRQHSDPSSASIVIQLKSTSASANTVESFLQQLNYLILQQQSAAMPPSSRTVVLLPPLIEQVRPYKPIDFVLPGQIGFSILFSTLFGIAFTFFGLREQLVLKRFFATPVNRINILVGIGVSRLFFQLISVSVLILFGHWAMDFTLANGYITFLEMLAVTAFMLFLLMGAGLLISSLAKVDSNIPLLINLFALPQMILSGTFFPVEVFPPWIQTICKILPLKHFNDAIRKISFEGLSLLDCGTELFVIGLWLVGIYFLTSRLIRWE